MHKLTNQQWRDFFLICADLLPPGAFDQTPVSSASWCSFTTFERLAIDAGYWVHGLPRKEDIGDTYIKDGGVWGQPYLFDDLAHLIIPRKFYWERIEGGRWVGNGHDVQDIEHLSATLAVKQIAHSLSALALEIKCY